MEHEHVSGSWQYVHKTITCIVIKVYADGSDSNSKEKNKLERQNE